VRPPIAALIIAGLAIAQLRHEREAVKLGGREDGLVLQFVQGISKLRVSAGETRMFGLWAEIFAERPASVQDRWHARLFLIKPLAIAALALFWVVTGLVTIGPGYGAAAAQLAASGFPAALVGPAVFWGGWFDVVLGFLLPVRRFTRPVLLLMLAVTPFYLLIGTLLAPHLWLDPLGPLLKIIPVLLATAFTLAIVDER